MTENTNIDSVISLAEMSRRLQISRSRLYQLIDENVMLPPVYLIATKKPFYTESMAQRNLEVKKRNIGINGQIVMFYCRQNLPQPAITRKVRKPQISAKKKSPNEKYTQLLEDLRGLGLTGVTSDQIEAAIQKCYPLGISQVDESEVLRSVFRAVKRQNTELNVRAKSTLSAE